MMFQAFALRRRMLIQLTYFVDYSWVAQGVVAAINISSGSDATGRELKPSSVSVLREPCNYFTSVSAHF